MRGRFFFALLFLSEFFFCPPINADTLYMKNKAELKGVIVEEYSDRYVLNTVEGEKNVPKGQVDAVKYDDKEQSYYQLGRDFQRVGRLQEALKAYQTAVKVRPDFQAASEAVFNVQRLVWLEEQSQLESEVERQKALISQAGQALPEFSQAGSSAMADAFGMFEKRFGCRLQYFEGWTVFTEIEPGSPAAQSGIREEDLLFSVWGDPVVRLSPSLIAEKLNNRAKECEIAIERAVKIMDSLKGGVPSVDLELSYDGLRVSRIEAGTPAEGRIFPGDLIIAINGQLTRYMTFSKAQEKMNKGGQMTLKIHRAVILRERFARYELFR